MSVQQLDVLVCDCAECVEEYPKGGWSPAGVSFSTFAYRERAAELGWTMHIIDGKKRDFCPKHPQPLFGSELP